VYLLRKEVADHGCKLYAPLTTVRAGLNYMIEQERRGAHVDPATETKRWSEEISEAGRKRARYQEMAAEGLIDFKELRTRLAALEDTGKTAEQKLRLAASHRAPGATGRDTDSVLESYADLMPEAMTLWDQKNVTERIE
jgi:hypothetical protein